MNSPKYLADLEVLIFSQDILTKLSCADVYHPDQFFADIVEPSALACSCVCGSEIRAPCFILTMFYVPMCSSDYRADNIM